MVEHDFIAGFQVGGDGAEGDGEAVEIGDFAHGEGQLAQGDEEFAPGDEAGGELGLALGGDADVEVLVEVKIALAGAQRQALAGRGIGEEVAPIGGLENFLDLRGRHAAGVQAPDDGTHARAGDAIDGDVELLERLEHAHVRDAAGAAAAQDEADLRAARGGLRGAGELLRGQDIREEGQPRDGKEAPGGKGHPWKE